MRKLPADPTLEAVEEALAVLQLHQRLLKLGLGEADALAIARSGPELEDCLALVARGCPLELLAPILS